VILETTGIETFETASHEACTRATPGGL